MMQNVPKDVEEEESNGVRATDRPKGLTQRNDILETQVGLSRKFMSIKVPWIS